MAPRAPCRRGPKRARGSPTKIRCGWKKCRYNTRDCKNVGYTLPITQVKKEECRPLRAHCKLVRFCCCEHLHRCHQKTPTRIRRGREALTIPQLNYLLWTLVHKIGCPWAAVLALCQLAFGERADCARRLDASWFSNLDPSSTSLPTVSIPKVNGKTTARTIAVPTFLAKLLWAWMDQPLVGTFNSQWPFPDHQLQQHVKEGKQRFLFPGRRCGGPNLRNFDSPVSERGYLEKLEQAAKLIAHERVQDRLEGKAHLFEDIDVNNIGTHTLKKSCVTLLKDAAATDSVVLQSLAPAFAPFSPSMTAQHTKGNAKQPNKPLVRFLFDIQFKCSNSATPFFGFT